MLDGADGFWPAAAKAREAAEATTSTRSRRFLYSSSSRRAVSSIGERGSGNDPTTDGGSCATTSHLARSDATPASATAAHSDCNSPGTAGRVHDEATLDHLDTDPPTHRRRSRPPQPGGERDGRRGDEARTVYLLPPFRG